MAREDWEAVIGLEIHVQLATRSKIFSEASTRYGEPPNTQVEPYSLGMPGMLPVLNRDVVELAMRLGCAVGATIHRTSRFARKHYFYPDLPKGYQISQYDEPLCTGGGLWAEVDGEERWFRLHRMHLEEDAGKTIHDPARGRSFVDFNRAGVPLLETVSEPDMRTPEEAVAYMKALHQIVVATGVCEGSMEKGHFRCDANVSVRRKGETAFGTKVELKNVNSFKFVGRGLQYEIDRQIEVLEDGGTIGQETRLWDEETASTKLMRTKEEAHDYRYFPEPDLMPLEIDEDWLRRVEQDVPELPRDRRKRFAEQYELSAYDAGVLTQSMARADFFEAVQARTGDPKLAANWIQHELLGLLNKDGRDVDESPITASGLAELLELLQAEKLSSRMAKDCFTAMFEEGIPAGEWVEREGGQITDEDQLARQVREVVDAHPDEVRRYHEGKKKLLGFFVGQVMKATGGKANPKQVNQLAQQILEERG